MLRKLLLAGVERPYALVLCLLALTVLAALGVPKVRIDTGFDRLILEKSADRQTYQRLTREFGSDNRTIVYVRDAALWTPEKLAVARAPASHARGAARGGAHRRPLHAAQPAQHRRQRGRRPAALRRAGGRRGGRERPPQCARRSAGAAQPDLGRRRRGSADGLAARARRRAGGPRRLPRHRTGACAGARHVRRSVPGRAAAHQRRTRAQPDARPEGAAAGVRGAAGPCRARDLPQPVCGTGATGDRRAQPAVDAGNARSCRHSAQHPERDAALAGGGDRARSEACT